MDEKTKKPLNRQKKTNAQNMPSWTKNVKPLPLALAVAMLVPFTPNARNVVEAAQTPPSTGAAQQKPLNEIQFPEYAGFVAHNFFEAGSIVATNDKQKGKADLKALILANEEIKKLLQDNGINTDTLDLEYNDQAVRGGDGGSPVAGPGRKATMGDIIVNLKDGGQTSKEIKLKWFYYKPAYAGNRGPNNIPASSSTHNVDKIIVADPNAYNLSKEDQEKIKQDFLTANPGFGLEKSNLSTDDQGNLTITMELGGKTHKQVVPASEHVSAIGLVPDIYVFLDPTKDGGQKATPIPENPGVLVPFKKGTYTKIAQGQDRGKVLSHLSGFQSVMEGDNLIKIFGVYDSKMTNTTGGRRVIVAKEDGEKEYRQSWSNPFMLRVLPVKQQTIIRNVDDTPKHIKAEEVVAGIDINYDALPQVYINAGKGWGLGQIGFGDIKNKNDLINDIKKKVTKEITADGLEHKVGIQNFTGTIKTDQGAVSPTLTATTIYYTETITDTLMKNPANLSPEEIAIIKEKVKQANAPLGLEDDDITVDNTGGIKIKVKDPNAKAGKTEVPFGKKAPLVTAKYDPETVAPGGKKESTITPSKPGDVDYTFPDGTTFVLPQDKPDGITVDEKGKVTYNVPENFEFDPGQDTKVVEGKVLVTLPGETKPTEVPYKFTVEKDAPQVTPTRKQNGDLELEVKDKDGQVYPKDSTISIPLDGGKKITGTVGDNGKVLVKNEDLPDADQPGKELTVTNGKTDSKPVPTTVPAKQNFPVKTIEVEQGTDAATIDAKTLGLDDNFANKDKVQKVEFKNTPDTNTVTPKGQDPTKYTATVTFEDGSTTDVDIPVKVKAKPQKDDYEPEAKPLEKELGEKPTEKEITDKVTVPNYPTGGDQPTFKVKDPDKIPDGNKPGDYKVPVTVTYPDGSEEDIDVKVTIKPGAGTDQDKDKYEPTTDPIVKDFGKGPSTEEIKDAVKIPNYPEDAKDKPVVSIDPDAKIPDGTKPGEFEISVTVTYPDGSVDKTMVKVTVKEEPKNPNGGYITLVPVDTPDAGHQTGVRPGEVREELLYEKRYMQGYGNGTFGAKRSLTRAEAAQILANALNSDGYNKRVAVNYTDLRADGWYIHAIETVTAAGVFEGYDDHSFKPEQAISRAEWIATLRRFQELGKVDGNSFGLRNNHWALQEIEAANKAGWLNIYKGQAKLDADQFIPREEVAAVTNQAFKKLVDKNYLRMNAQALVNYKDVDRQSPYYEEILAASNTLYRYGNKSYVGHEVNGNYSKGIDPKDAKYIYFQNNPR